MVNKKVYISASLIGQTAFCPYSAYYRERNVPLSNDSQRRIERGNRKHAEYNKRYRSNGVGLFAKILIVVVVIFLVFLVLARMVN